jgi:hypothetical protein
MSEVVLRRFYSYCVVDLETGCWNWTGATTKRGYGVFQTGCGQYEVHNASYQHFVGEVPDGLELGHIRQDDKCAFWEHVRPVTHEENLHESNNMRVFGQYEWR